MVTRPPVILLLAMLGAMRASAQFDRTFPKGPSWEAPAFNSHVAHSERHAANSVEHGGTGIGLSEERGATRCFGECACSGILVSGDADERRIAAFGHESLAKIDTGYLSKMNVEHQAVELGMFLVREERLS